MRFVYGPPPVDPDFQPAEDGWTAWREPSPLALGLLGGGLGLPLAAALWWAWKQVVPHWTPSIRINGLLPGGHLGLALALLLAPPVFFALLVFFHELCHALITPRFGFSRQTLMGAWPRKLLFYAGYEGAMCRAHYLGMVAAPFLLLSVLPLLGSLAARSVPDLWPIISIVNALCCGGDLIIIYLVVTQVPPGAIIRNHGWNSWWKSP